MKGKFYLGFLILVLLGGVLVYFFFFKNQNNLIQIATPITEQVIDEDFITPPPGGGPTQGPYVHKLMSASSSDGVNWSLDEAIVMEHASVPDIFVRTDGDLEIVYVDAAKAPKGEGIGCALSEDNGENWETKNCLFEGWEGIRTADPSMVVLPDGRYRLYSYVSDLENMVNSLTIHSVRSAISEDGYNFVDEGEVFSYFGLVDPDVFWNGEEWVMFFTSMTDNTQEGLKILAATSSDGLTFEYKQELDIDEFILVQPILMADGTLRVFGFDRYNQQTFKSFVSENGFDWTQEEGVLLAAQDGKRITDPQFVQLPNGEWKMILKIEDVR